jgi:hypothetical protein
MALVRSHSIMEKRKFTVDRVCFVDSTFLQIFDFKLLQGDRNTALEKA